jgi:argininosuccinate lyase
VRQVLTGRIADGPSDLVSREVLEPQFRYEAEHLLSYYVLVEKVLLVEYGRLGLLTQDQVASIAAELDRATPATISADRDANMSDMAFALECFVTGRLAEIPVAWHVDRSRNDLQSCVQLMFGRAELARCAQLLISCASEALALAGRWVTDPMPGYTHLQAAQVITPGFFVAALSGHLVRTLGRLLATYDGINRCPLGGGAMAGQELDWDRDLMASLLGFTAPNPHALAAVASRAWALEISGEISTFGVGLGRFVTDLMSWAGGAYGFVDLPDHLAGISSAMPQKRNFPVLERIRGKTAHLTSGYLDIAMVQRGASFSNSVEVAKEGGGSLASVFQTFGSVLALTTAVLAEVSFLTGPMRRACEAEYLDGFSLANRLTLRCSVPWRTAQVIAGRYIAAAVRDGKPPAQADPAALRQAARDSGFEVSDPGALLDGLFDPERSLQLRRSAGSPHPDSMRRLLADQQSELDGLTADWAERAVVLDAVPARIDRMLGAGRPAPVTRSGEPHSGR